MKTVLEDLPQLLTIVQSKATIQISLLHERQIPFMAILEFIRGFLEPVQPRSLLAVGPSPWPELEHYCQAGQVTYQHWDIRRPLEIAERFDLSVVYNFEDLEKSAVRSQLGALKNLLSGRVWVLAAKTSDWEMKDFVELGFVRDSLPVDISAQSYSYNLATYNHQREWNNPRFWANPQRWHIRF